MYETVSNKQQTGTASIAPFSEHSSIQSFMSGFTLETTPASAEKIHDFGEILRPGATVYITSLPGSNFSDTISTAKRLRNEGFSPAPHFASRSINSETELEEHISRLTGEAGVDQVLIIAGSAKPQSGPFSSSMDLLETGLFDKYGIKQIGVAGHPEGSPDITDEAIRSALAWKNGFAARSDAHIRIVTQFCFEAEPIIAWDQLLNAQGNKLPISIGVPGIAKFKTLINFAIACGVGNSIQFIKKQASNVTRLLRPQSPDKLLRDLAAYSAKEPNCGIDRVHIYPLGGLRKSAQWSYAISDGDFDFTADGFKVNIELD